MHVRVEHSLLRGCFFFAKNFQNTIDIHVWYMYNKTIESEVKTVAKVEITCTDEYKDKIKENAQKKGVSVAAYIKWAISEQIEKHEKVK